MAAEKRQLTILNCDMVGSTLLAEELDPEVFEVIIQSFIDLSVEIVQRNQGVFAINTGDGYEAYFYPGTGSPAAMYAIECGLDIQRSLQARNVESEHPISVRVGITTGQVVLSPHKLSSDVVVDIAFGRPAHFAARLQSVAEPGTVYVDDVTQESAAQYFNFTHVGQKLLKGFNKPVDLWRVASHRQSGSRFESRLSKLSPLVGRVAEVQQLHRCWSAVSEGRGQAVAVVGEPGIGKSRLVYEVCNLIDEKPINLQSLENHENTPLHPWIRLIESISNTSPRDSVDERVGKLQSTLNAFLPLDNDQSQTLLSLMVHPKDKIVDEDSSPRQKLDELCIAIVDAVLELARYQPKLIVVEDIHWVDPTSRTLLDMLIEKVEQAKVFILITSRPEKLEYLENPKITRLSLKRLTHSQTMELAMSEMQGVLTERVEEIVRWSDGNPLFVEEIAKSSVDADSGKTFRNIQPQTVGEFRPSVPNSLQEPLLARIDRLGSAKQLAQVASVIGREFDQETLELLQDGKTAEVLRDLAVLVDAGILVALEGGRYNFTFKHALIQDVVYKNLLDRDAIVLHKRLSQIYQNEFASLQRSHPEVIAHHLSLAREWEDAAELWLTAGIVARNTGSNLEAKGRLERGLEAAAHLGETLEAKQLKATIQLTLGQVISAHYGPVNIEGHRALENAVSIGEEIGDADCVVSAQTYLMWLKFDSGAFNVTLSAADKLTDFAKRAGNHQAAAIGLLGSGMCQFAMGQFERAGKSLQESLDYLDYDIGSVEGYPGKAYTYLGLVEHIMGDRKKAFDLCQHSIEVSADQGNYDLAAALGNSLYLSTMQHDLRHMEETSNRLMALAEKTGFIKWYYQGVFFLGGVYAARGEDRGLDMMQEAIDRFEQSEELVELSIFYGLLADRYLLNDVDDQAHHWVDKGLWLVEKFGECFVEVPLLRLKARCIEKTAKENTEEIERLRQQANGIAQEQGATVWQFPGDEPGRFAVDCQIYNSFP